MSERASRRIGLALGAGGLAIFAGQLAYFFPATCDDAFISFRYARNLALGEGLVFNAGERVEGFSNFLWVMALAGLHALGADLVLAAKCLGILAALGLLALVLRSLRDSEWGPIERGGLVFILGCNWPLAYYAVSGLETVPYAMLLAAAAALFVGKSGRLGVAGCLVLLAAALTRPEGVLFAGAFAVAHAVRNREVRSLIAPLGIFASGYAAFLAWRYSYFGALVPNTYLVKSPMREGLGDSGWVRLLAGGMDEIVAFVAHTGGPVVLMLACGALAWSLRRSFVAASAALLAGGLFFEKFAGGDWMAGYRFLVPVLAFYLVLAIEGLRELASRLTWPRPRIEAGIAGFVLVIGLWGLSGTFEFHLQRGRYPYFIMTGEDMVRAGKWIGERYDPSTEIVCWRIGALAYHSRLRVIDTWGLTDEVVARMRYEGRLSEESLAAYLASRDPELVLTTERLAPGEIRKMWGTPYRVLRTFPQGSRSVWALWERSSGSGAPDSEDMPGGAGFAPDL